VVRDGAISVAGGTTLGVRIGGVPGVVCANDGDAKAANRQAQKPNFESGRRHAPRRTADRAAGPAAGVALSVTLPILASVLI
jgi:hypothetical protein